MSFVQIIEYTTTRIDEIRALGEKYRSNLENDTSPTRVLITQDREAPNTYRTIVEFPSYEIAMQNSERPETSEFAARMGELVDGPPRFYNLDVVETM